VSIAGVSDVSKLAWDRIRWYGGNIATEDMTGTDPVLLAAESPARHADRIKVARCCWCTARTTRPCSVSTARSWRGRSSAPALPHELVLTQEGEHSLLEPSIRLTLCSKLEAFSRPI
jgi:hypothetical protein